MFILLLIACVFAQHTKIYEENWNINGNANNYFYHRGTFGKDVYDDPCVKITNNAQFRNYINENIICEGKWCIDSKFNTNKKRDDYEVEHIIDLNGPEYNSCGCTSIVGNLVMAYGRWNAGLGGLAKHNYTNSEKEKTIVYGKYIMDSVRNVIEKCNPLCVNNYIGINGEINSELNNDIVVILIYLGIIVCGSCIVFILYCVSKKSNYDYGVLSENII